MADVEIGVLIRQRLQAARWHLDELVKLADKEIGRRMVYGDEGKPESRADTKLPENRQAPSLETADGAPEKRGPGRPRKTETPPA